MGKRAFAVKSEDFSRYKEFKSYLEHIGYRYYHRFTSFVKGSMIGCSNLYISADWRKDNDFLFSFSNASSDTKVFDLDDPVEYMKACAYAVDFYKNRPKVKVSLEKIARWQGCTVGDLIITNNDE